MPITVTCACGQTYPIREEFAGQRVQCPSCQQMLTIPMPSGGKQRAQRDELEALDSVEPVDAVEDVEAVAVPEPVKTGGGVSWLLLGCLGSMFLLCGGGAVVVAVVAVAISQAEPTLVLNGTNPAPPPPPPPVVLPPPPPATQPSPLPPPLVVPVAPTIPPLPDLPVASGQPFDGHLAPINTIGFSRDGRVALSAAGGFEKVGDKMMPVADNTVRIWDAQTGKEQSRVRNFRDGIAAAAFSPDGRYALLAGAGQWKDGNWSPVADGVIHLWDLQKDEEVRVLQGHTRLVFCLAFSADGKRCVSGSADFSVRYWNVETGKEIYRFDGHTSTVTSVDLSPDGLYALSGAADNTVRLWDLANGGEKRQFAGHKDIVWAVAFSPDGKQAVSGGGMQKTADGGFADGAKDYDIRLWDVEAGTETLRFHGHQKAVQCVAFSRDGRRLVSGDIDNTVRAWQVANGEQVGRYDGHGGALHALAFFPDGRRSLSGGEDKTLRVWTLPPDLLDLVKNLEDDDAATRLNAAKQIPRFGAELRPYLPALLKALTRDDAAVRPVLLEVVAKLGPPTRAEGPVLELLLKEQAFPALHFYALESLVALGADYPATLPAVRETLKDPDVATKRKAILYIGQLGPAARDEFYSALIDLVGNANADVSNDAAAALVKMGKPMAKDLPLLADLLRSDKKGVRRYALLALTDAGPDAANALPRISEVLEIDKEPELRRLALAAIVKIQTNKKETLSLLKKSLKDADREMATQAVRSLAAMSSEEEAQAALLELLTSPNEVLAKAAEEALPQLKFEKSHVKALAKILRTSKSESLRLRLMDTLVALKPDTGDAAEALGVFLKDAKGETRVKIVSAIGELGSTGWDAGPALAEVFKAKDVEKDLRFQVAVTLCKTHSEQAGQTVPFLVAALRVDDLKNVEALARQKQAHEALKQLGKPAVAALAKALDIGFIGPGELNANARLEVVLTLGDIGPDAKSAEQELGFCAKKDGIPLIREEAKKALMKVRESDGK
jgi:WD40 repeat protein/HEAT repeat protein